MASRSSAAARALARAIANGARSSRPAARSSGAWRSIEQLAVPLSRGVATCAVAAGQQSTSRFLLPFAAATVAAAWTTSTVMAAEAERTFIAIKPDGVQRGLIADIVERFERKGYKLVAIKLVKPTKAFAERHYHDLKGRPFFNGLTDFLSSGPVVAMVWEGPGVITYGRKLIGATNPQASEPGTIRGDLAVVTGRNVIHGSDGPETAKAEIALWFKPEELVNYELDAHKWVYE